MPLKKGYFIKEDELAGIAIHNNCVIAERKVRMIADIIRNENVNKALSILERNQKSCVRDIKVLITNAITNLQNKCVNLKIDLFNTNELYIATINVDKASMLKRTLPAPHGRVLRINKRRSHIVVVVKPQKKTNIEKPSELKEKVENENELNKKLEDKTIKKNLNKKNGSANNENKNIENLGNNTNLKDKNNNNKNKNGTESKSN